MGMGIGSSLDRPDRGLPKAIEMLRGEHPAESSASPFQVTAPLLPQEASAAAGYIVKVMQVQPRRLESRAVVNEAGTNDGAENEGEARDESLDAA